MRRRDKKKFYTSVLVGLLLLIGLGYAYIHTDLSINGDAIFKRATWNIHWVSPPTVSSGSVSGTSVTTAAHVTGTNNDTVEYSITLTNPRDYYDTSYNNTRQLDYYASQNVTSTSYSEAKKLYNGSYLVGGYARLILMILTIYSL